MTPHGIDAHKILDQHHLWVGSYPQTQLQLAVIQSRFPVWIRVAKELPHNYALDDNQLDEAQIRAAKEATAFAVASLLRNRPVLITCAQGRNRSALVAAMTLIHGFKFMPQAAIDQVRQRRIAASGGVLSNDNFVRYLLSLR